MVEMEKMCADVREMYELYDAKIESLEAQLRRGVPDGAHAHDVTDARGLPRRIWARSRVVPGTAGRGCYEMQSCCWLPEPTPKEDA